jgi:fatty acid desaturase
MELFLFCVFGISFFVLVFGFILLMRFFAYRETIALAEKGLVRPHKQNDGKTSLRWGIIITALGAALCLGLWPIGFLTGSTGFPFGFGPWMIVGLIPMFFGLALLLIYVLTHERGGKEAGDKPESEEVEP